MTASFRVLVCGGRNYQNKDALHVQDETPLDILELMVIDLTDTLTVNSYVQLEAYPAEWNLHGRTAGPVRNRRMIEEGKPDLVLAFPGGQGTADLVRRARAAGIEVREVEA